MKSFISKVVNAVLNKNLPLSQITIILPSHRAGLFVKEAFKKQCTSTTFLPKIISIEEFVAEISELELLNNLHLLFEFYSVYKENTKNEPESFDQFYEWASVVINDFNEIDRHLINSDTIFDNLSDINRIKDWSPQTPLTQSYLNFFDYLKTYYHLLYLRLLDQKKGYQGMLYRESVQNIHNFINNHQNHHFVFAGFNALNKAEETLFQELLEHNLATVYWDVTKEILDAPFNIGYFLKKYKEEWNYYKTHPFLWVYEEPNKEIEIKSIAIPKKISQLKYAGEILQQLPDFTNTALVLADENLLPVALNSLPNNVKQVNITMGLPLDSVPAKQFIDKLFLLLEANKDKNQHAIFYYKDIYNFFRLPYVLKLASSNFTTIEIYFQKNIIEQNKLFVSEKELQELLNDYFPDYSDVLNPFFDPTDNQVPSIIKNVIRLIYELLNLTDGLDREYLLKFYSIFLEQELLSNEYEDLNSVKILKQVFLQLLKSEQLSFHGEPLSGLQIMGVLESRALDFKTLIITGVNEGILPKGSKEFSFIPFDIKKHFNLPTFLERDIIFSYHFFRLLQRANNVYLIFNGETDVLGASEKSRFLVQLEMLHPEIKNVAVAPKVTNNSINPIQIEKTPEIIEKIKGQLESGISPSALATYVRNPVEFYQKYVLNIHELKDVEESVEASTFGNIIHEVLQNLFTPQIGQVLSKESIEKMKKVYKNELEHQFSKHYKSGDLKTGKNKLITEVAKKYIELFLNIELEELNKKSEVVILDLEKELTAKIHFNNLDFPITLKGKVDRIDVVENNHRIIDYKTGKVTATELKLKDFEDIIGNEKKSKAMQLLLYGFMYFNQTENNHVTSLACGNISFKNLKEGFVKVNISEETKGRDFEITREKLKPFIEEIGNLIAEILNPELPFIEKTPEFLKR